MQTKLPFINACRTCLLDPHHKHNYLSKSVMLVPTNTNNKQTIGCITCNNKVFTSLFYHALVMCKQTSLLNKTTHYLDNKHKYTSDISVA